MPEDIVIRWAGPADATASSTYRIERTLDNATWSTLAAGQAATGPYVSPASTVAGDTPYGATSLALADASAFSTSGHGWLEDALVEWMGTSGNTLTGVTWRSGYGTYAGGTAITEVHESYADSGVAVALNAAVYRVTHIDAGGRESAPGYIWYYSPPRAESSRHCVVVVSIQTDLGVEPQENVNVQAYLAADTEFDTAYGAHLDAGQSANKTKATNAFGLAFFQCRRSSKRDAVTGPDAAYVFVLDSSDANNRLAVEAATIPDRDWVLLSQIVTAVR